MKDIVSVLMDTHETVKENMAMTLDYLSIFERSSGLSKREIIKNTMKFLSKNLVEHFKREEIMIDVMKKHFGFSVEEQQIISKILKEHKILLPEFERLNEIASKYKPSDKKIVKDFVDTSRKIFDDLFEHAKLEDEKLFPLAREKLSEEHLEIIEKQWQLAKL